MVVGFDRLFFHFYVGHYFKVWGYVFFLNYNRSKYQPKYTYHRQTDTNTRLHIFFAHIHVTIVVIFLYHKSSNITFVINFPKHSITVNLHLCDTKIYGSVAILAAVTKTLCSLRHTIAFMSDDVINTRCYR